MKSKKVNEKYVAFLRGINVGGHHKVPMADLKKELGKLKLENVVTLLNSGNIIFDSIHDSVTHLENMMSAQLEKSFGFSIPTIIRHADVIDELLRSNPFKDVELTKDIRLYVSFLRNNENPGLKLPWKSDDSSFEIIGQCENVILSLLDLAISKTPKAMGALEKSFGKDITTRNWKTIERIGKIL